MNSELSPQLHHGRGAVSCPAGRFEHLEKMLVDDGWMDGRDEAPKLSTHLHRDTARSVINNVDSPDLGFTRSINPYRGCEHGCIYCYARPSHGYLGFSAGLDFETEIFHKDDAPVLLRQELAAKNYRPSPILIGSNTDCYQPVERELKLTRAIIAVLSEHHHPLMITTKSALVARDIDLLAPMAEQKLACVNISLTSLDGTLARAMEPRAAAPYKRLKAMELLAKAGIPVGVMTSPLIPALNDMELERLLQSARDAGASYAHYTVVRLPFELKSLFEEWLRRHYPERADRVLSLIRQMRGGKLYDAEFGQRMTGQGEYADLIAQRFALATKKFGYNLGPERMRIDLFQQPEEKDRQLDLGF